MGLSVLRDVVWRVNLVDTAKVRFKLVSTSFEIPLVRRSPIDVKVHEKFIISLLVCYLFFYDFNNNGFHKDVCVCFHVLCLSINE